MKLYQVTDVETAVDILAGHFTFENSSDAPTMIHVIDIGSEIVGYVATEDMKPIGGPHIFIKPEYRKPFYIKRMIWLFDHVYCPLMKALGYTHLATNCKQGDTGTHRFFEMLGFKTKHIVAAERKL